MKICDFITLLAILKPESERFYGNKLRNRLEKCNELPHNDFYVLKIGYNVKKKYTKRFLKGII